MNQLSLLDNELALDAGWCADDWETPDKIATYMASCLLSSDRYILEPAAGTGQIVKHIEPLENRKVSAIEINPARHQRLLEVLPNAMLWNFLESGSDPLWDVIITNPPFSLGLEFIEKGLSKLSPKYEYARLLFLLPATFFQSRTNYRHMKRLDCRIYQRHSFVGRIAYLKHGKPQSGRQCDDCLFDIRPGKIGASEPEKFVEI